MAINPETVDKVSEIVGSELKREGTNWKEFMQYIRNIPKVIIKDILLIAPRFILLLIKILKSKEVDTGVKLLFIGMIVVLSTLTGFIIWDIPTVAILGLLASTLGWTTALATVFFGAGIILFKSVLTAGLVLISMFLCNMLITTEELKDLAIEAFGEKEGTSFIEKFNLILGSIDSSIEKFIFPVKEFFIKIGKKKSNKDLDNKLSKLEEKIESKID